MTMFDDDLDPVVGGDDDATVAGDDNCIECGKPMADCTCPDEEEDEDGE